jgi:probable HAF family extracellular repeat protein
MKLKISRMLAIATSLSATASLGVPVPAASPPTLYNFTTIDVPGAPGTAAYGINCAGKIVGGFGGLRPGLDVPLQGFLYTDGSFITVDVPGATDTDARSINDAGRVVGAFKTDTGGHGFVRSANGVFTTIDVPGAIFTSASGINNAGKIVGIFDTATGGHGFLRDANGSFTTIDVPGAGNTTVDGINDAGQIVGVFNGTTGEHGFLYNNGSFITIDVPGASSTHAVGIDNAGRIVGSFFDAKGVVHAFVATPLFAGTSGKPNCYGQSVAAPSPGVRLSPTRFAALPAATRTFGLQTLRV